MRPPNAETDILGDQWKARIRREHERHAGIPDYGYCPGSRPRREVRMVTSADLAGLRRDFSAINPVVTRPVGSIAYDPVLLTTVEGRRFLATGEVPPGERFIAVPVPEGEARAMDGNR